MYFKMMDVGIPSIMQRLTSFLKDVNTWYLADALLSSPDGAKGTTILVSSPSEKHYSGFLKCSHVVPLHYLPIWSLDELKLMGPSYNRSEDVVKKRFNMIGGLPRYVLEKDDDLKEKVEEKSTNFYRIKLHWRSHSKILRKMRLAIDLYILKWSHPVTRNLHGF